MNKPIRKSEKEEQYKGKEEMQGERINHLKGKGKTPGYGPGFILSLFLVHHSFL